MVERKNRGAKADLSYADLSGMDLRFVDLSYANLKCSIFNDVDFEHANLEGSNLSCSCLERTNFHEANLSYAILSNSNLRESDLSHSNLTCSDLSYADLRDVDLRGAILSLSILGRSASYKTNLDDSCLIEIDLKNVKYDHGTSFLALQCPEKGSFIGYKKSDDKIVELRIEEDSLRSSATSRRCRASKVTVLSITSLDNTEEFKEVSNTGRYEFTYRVGETYEVKDFDTNRWNECSAGIHFFITRDEAVKYQ